MKDSVRKEKGRCQQNNTASQNMHLSSYAENPASESITCAIMAFREYNEGHLFDVVDSTGHTFAQYACDLVQSESFPMAYVQSDVVIIAICAGKDMAKLAYATTWLDLRNEPT